MKLEVIFLQHYAPPPSVQNDGEGAVPTNPGPLSMDDLDQTISAFDTVEQVFRTLNPNTWRQDLDIFYSKTPLLYRSRFYKVANRLEKGEHQKRRR